MLGIDSGWSDMAWQMNPPREGILIEMLQNIFEVHLLLYAPKNFFQNSQF